MSGRLALPLVNVVLNSAHILTPHHPLSLSLFRSLSAKEIAQRPAHPHYERYDIAFDRSLHAPHAHAHKRKKGR